VNRVTPQENNFSSNNNTNILAKKIRSERITTKKTRPIPRRLPLRHHPRPLKINHSHIQFQQMHQRLPILK
jgi:hypothetical protein